MVSELGFIPYLIFIVLFVNLIPIICALARGISRDNLIAIIVLLFVGLLVAPPGVSWLIAMIISCRAKGDREIARSKKNKRIIIWLVSISSLFLISILSLEAFLKFCVEY